jgi:hypothetical protein
MCEQDVEKYIIRSVIMCTLHANDEGCQINEGGMSGTCSMYYWYVKRINLRSAPEAEN